MHGPYDTNHPDVDKRDWDYVPDAAEMQTDWDEKHGIYQDDDYEQDEIDEMLDEEGI